ncbi:MAG: dioxygenase, partial [Ilumatobacteraceae bacterium]
MPSTDPTSLLCEVLARYEQSPNPRLREVTEAAIRHLHAFALEVGLQRDEWFAGIQFLTATGKISDDVRQEFILLSDSLGVSSLVEVLTHDGVEGSTENTVLGPFYVPGSPERELGSSMLVDPDDGDRVVVRGRITDL